MRMNFDPGGPDACVSVWRIRDGGDSRVEGGSNRRRECCDGRVLATAGAEPAILVYRRSREEMPARIEEVHHAEEEGIVLKC